MYCVWLLLVFSAFSVGSEELYELNIVHYNDFHARFVETSPAGTICNPSVAPCIGGFARLATLIRQALDKNPDSLVLNGGDSFQGTIWYNLLRWNVTQDFMNMVHHDAHVLGNHEFDNGIEGVVPYLQHLKSPVVTANIIDDDEPTIKGLYKPSIVVTKRNRKIGIIGVIIASTDNLASTGDLKFTDEVEAVKREAEKLHEQGINIIVVLSHCGLDIDKLIALNAGPYIDIIVGGHSHTLLSNTNPPEDSPFNPQGPYPYVVEQPTRSVLIVQVGAHTAFLGEIKLSFNDDGNLINWTGDPHYISNDVVQAPDVLQKVNEYLPLIKERATELIGVSKVHLSSQCNCGECNLGSLVCDAFLHETVVKSGNNKWNEAHFCVVNTGGVRSNIEAGNVTFENILLSTPFENNVEMFDLRGEHILEMLEYAVANDPFPGARMLQVSGLRAVFDGALSINSRVISATVRCNDCDIPRYDPLDPNKVYKVVSQAFIAGGGDGFSISIETLDNTPIESVKEQVSCLCCDLRLHGGPKKLVTSRAVHQRLSEQGVHIIGIRVVFDGSLPLGSRLVSASVRCIECPVPAYQPLRVNEYYKVLSPDFIGNGGGGFTMISNNRKNVEVLGVDYDVLLRYIRHQTPVLKDLDGRIQIKDPCIRN